MRTVNPLLARRMALVLTILCLAACEGPHELPEDDGLTWHRSVPRPRRHGDLSQKEYVRLYPPESRVATHDDQTGIPIAPRLVLNFMPSGSLKFKGNTYPIEDDDARDTALEALRLSLYHSTAPSRWRDVQGASLCPVLLHADRSTPWHRITMIMELALAEPVYAHTFHWAVLRPWTPGDWMYAARVEFVDETEVADPACVVRLEGLEGDEGVGVRIEVEGQAWTFEPSPDVFQDAVALAQANAAWSEVRGAVSGRRQARRRVELAIPRDRSAVPLAYVITILGFLLEEGYRVIDLPEPGWRLVFEAPDPALPRLVDDPLVTPLFATAVVLGLLLGVLVTLGPRWRRRSRAKG